MLVFGFQGLDCATMTVASLYAAETVTASGNVLMKSDSHRGSRPEGIATIAAGSSLLKPEKESDRLKNRKETPKLDPKTVTG